MKLIRMCLENENIKERCCTWWISDYKRPLINSLNAMQQYLKDGSFILAEIDDDLVLNGEFTLGTDDICTKYDSKGSTGINNFNFVSISCNDIDKLNIIHKGQMKRKWKEIFDICNEFGFNTGA